MCDLTLEKHTMQVVSPPMDDSGALWRPVILPASLSARTDEAVFPSAQEMPIVGSTSEERRVVLSDFLTFLFFEHKYSHFLKSSLFFDFFSIF